jgi:hypothetical protein
MPDYSIYGAWVCLCIILAGWSYQIKGVMNSVKRKVTLRWSLQTDLTSVIRPFRNGKGETASLLEKRPRHDISVFLISSDLLALSD